MPREPLRYAVTFEQLTQPPVTVRGTIVAASLPAAVRYAVKDAKRQAKGRPWASVVVLLERDSPLDRPVPPLRCGSNAILGDNVPPGRGR